MFLENKRKKQSRKRLQRSTRIMPETEDDSCGINEMKSLTRSVQMSMISNELTRLKIYQGSDHVLAKDWHELYDNVSDLHFAAFYGSLVSIKRIIKERRGGAGSSVGVDSPTEDGPKLLKEPTPGQGEVYGKENFAGFFLNTTPLMMAAQQGHLSVVKYLVEDCHADIYASDSLGLTPLSLACSFNRRDVAKYLLSKHAKVNVTERKNAMTPTILASVNNHTDMCELLLGHHANVHIVDMFGRQAMHYAAWNYNWKAVELLYHHDNKSINVQDNDRNTPLHLLVSDVNVDIEVNSVGTVTHDQSILDIVKQLAKYEGTTVDIKRESKRGTNRVGEDHECLVRMLILGASVNIRNDKGQTPLHLLCNRLTPVFHSQGYLYIDEPTTTQNLLVMLIILIKSGCSVHAPDFQGKTPLSLSVDRKNWLAANFLGADSVMRSELTVDRFKNLADTVAMFGWGNLFELKQTRSEILYISSAVLLQQKDNKIQRMAKRIIC